MKRGGEARGGAALGGSGGVYTGRVEETPLFPLFGSPWGEGEQRPRLFREAEEALEAGDPGPLLEAFRLYLWAVEKVSPSTAQKRAAEVAAFLRFLALLGRRGLFWERGDFLRYREDLARRSRTPSTFLSHRAAVAAFLRFASWAGARLPPLDLPHREVASRRNRPLTREEYEALLEALPGFPSVWRLPFAAAVALVGEFGLYLHQALALRPEDLRFPGPRVRLPGGQVEALHPRARAFLEDYASWREERRSPFPRFLLDYRGEGPMSSVDARHAMRSFRVYSGLSPLGWTVLRLTGQARLVERFGAREAQRLLRRVFL